jgi:hypothetical protein
VNVLEKCGQSCRETKWYRDALPKWWEDWILNYFPLSNKKIKKRRGLWGIAQWWNPCITFKKPWVWPPAPQKGEEVTLILDFWASRWSISVNCQKNKPSEKFWLVMALLPCLPSLVKGTPWKHFCLQISMIHKKSALVSCVSLIGMRLTGSREGSWEENASAWHLLLTLLGPTGKLGSLWGLSQVVWESCLQNGQQWVG